MKRYFVILTDSRSGEHSRPWDGVHVGKNWGSSGDRGRGGNVGKNLYCGFQGKKMDRVD